MRGRLVIAAFAILFLSPLVRAAEPAALDTYRSQFEDSRKKIEAERQATRQMALDKYATSLDAAIERAKSAGDLEALMAAKQEKERFGREKNVPRQSPGGESQVVAAIRKAYHAFLAQGDAACDRMLAELLARYVKALDELKKSFVAADKIEEALKVKAEMEKTEFMLADARARIPKSEPPPDQPAGPPASATSPALRSLPPELRPALLLYFNFDKDEGGKVTDQSGKGNNATVNGTRWTKEGRTGGACEFSGDGATLDMQPNGLDRIGDATLCFWINSIQPTAYDLMVLEHYRNDGNGLGIRVAGNGMALYGAVDGKAAGVANGVITHGKWQHFAAVMGRGGMKLFINGTLVDENADCKLTFKDVGRSVSSAIGRTFYTAPHLGGPCWFKGKLDEFMVFDRALTAEQIRRLQKIGGGLAGPED